MSAAGEYAIRRVWPEDHPDFLEYGPSEIIFHFGDDLEEATTHAAWLDEQVPDCRHEVVVRTVGPWSLMTSPSVTSGLPKETQ